MKSTTSTPSTTSSNTQESSSSLYIPYRAIGYITDGVPFIINILGDEQFLISSIGKAFQVFKLDHLNSCLVSQQLSDPITALQAYHHETFVAVKSSIYVFHRTNIVKKYDIHDSDIVGLAMIGHILLSYDAENVIQIVDTKARKVLDTLKLLQESQISFLMHPATYVNKFLIGFENGHMELWNIRTKSLIYTFNSHVEHLMKHTAKAKSEFKMPAITYMEQSPACDVCAIGFSSGDILLMNLKTDKVLFSFKQGQAKSKDTASVGNEVTSISFRTDTAAERFPYMTTGSSDGRVYIWHLGCPGRAEEPRRLMLTLEEAHGGRISKIQFLHGEPVMVTSAEDNSIKMWIFDSADGTPRLLRGREGHKGSSTRIRFYGAVTTASMRDNADGMSCEILSAGADNTFRLFNFALESQNREITQKPILKKLGIQRRNERLPPIIGFDYCETRQYDWSDVATIHQNHSNTYLWRFRNRTISEIVLKQPSWKLNNLLNANIQTEVEKARNSTSVCMSSCGNYCVVGSNGGIIYLYNAQSGLPRGSFPQLEIDQDTSSLEYQKSRIPGNILHDQKKILGLDGSQDSYRANSLSTTSESTPMNSQAVSGVSGCSGHTAAVTGVFLNLVNTVLVTCGLDGLVIFWNFYTHQIESFVQLSSPQCKLEPFREGDLVCVVGQDRILRLYDLTSKKLCRRFDGKAGHSRAISDICFTPDGRRLLSASYDMTVRVWDLPTSRCLSWMKFSSPITSMCMSLSGEYLCLTMADTEGIQMYLDRSLYETVHFWKEPTEPVMVEDCRVKSETTVVDKTEADDHEEPEVIAAVQAQVDGSEAPEIQKARKEDKAQRGSGLITMAALPKAYWLTLFNLESIKERNKPTAAPTAPPQAPFFLPTIVKSSQNGLAPAFPTPSEYAKLQTPQQTPPKAEANSKELASSWQDEDGDGNDDDWGDTNWNTSFPDEENPSPNVETETSSVGKKRKNESTYQSRIIRRNVELPRSHLVSRIDKQFPSGPIPLTHLSDDISPIKEYLMSLAPPAVDTQMRSLHNGLLDDTRGIELIHCMIIWFTYEFQSGMDYEILQAYLGRFLFIYSELLVQECPKNRHLKDSLQQLHQIHTNYCEKFRHLIQSNLCVLKLMAQITSI